MVLGIQPNVALCCVGIFILVLYLTRWVSLSSILASYRFPVFILFIFNEPEHLYRIFAVIGRHAGAADAPEKHQPDPERVVRAKCLF
jgi:glycerol-3-phosphate acyltransferase PlsY